MLISFRFLFLNCFVIFLFAKYHNVVWFSQRKCWILNSRLVFEEKKYREIKNRNNARIGNQSEVFPDSPKISVRQRSLFPRLTVINGVSFSCASRNFLSCSGKGHAYSHPSFPRGYSRRDTCELPTIGCSKTTQVSNRFFVKKCLDENILFSRPRRIFLIKINILCKQNLWFIIKQLKNKI